MRVRTLWRERKGQHGQEQPALASQRLWPGGDCHTGSPSMPQLPGLRPTARGGAGCPTWSRFPASFGLSHVSCVMSCSPSIRNRPGLVLVASLAFSFTILPNMKLLESELEDVCKSPRQSLLPLHGFIKPSAWAQSPISQPQES